MGSVDGQPLSRVLRGQPLPAGTVVTWGLELSRLLAAIHARGGICRDLKPANIVVDAQGAVRLLDSGLSGMTSSLDVSLEPGAGVPVFLGAPQYMSPEQVRREPLDTRSDVFSLGVVLYEMTTGKRPFTGPSHEAILAEILRAQPVPPHVLAPGIPEKLEAAILKSLAQNRRDRYQSMEDLIRDLEGVATELESGGSSQRGRRVTDRPVAPPASRRRWLIVAAAAVAAMIAALFVVRPLATMRVDERAILVVPMEVHGQSEGADYLGRSFSEAVAVNLAQAKELHVLPVPQAAELLQVGTLDRAAAARAVGAGLLLTGSLAREGSQIDATLSLQSAVENRLLWGTRLRADDGDLSALASRAARQTAQALDVTFPRLYDYVGNLVGGPSMAASPYLSQALGAMRQGEIAPLLEATEKLLASFPSEPDALALRSHALMLAHDADPSPDNRRAFEAALDALDTHDPGNPYGSFYRAALLFKDNRPTQAVAKTSEILDREDVTPAVRAWVLRHRAFVKGASLGDQEGALQDLEHALVLDPASARTFHILADTLLGLGRYDEALTRARQAVALMPSYWRNQQTLGLVLTALGQHAPAREAYAAACRLGNTQSACALNAIALIRHGDKEEAGRVAAHAMGLTEDPEGAYNLACYWALAGDRGKAIANLRRAFDFGYTRTEPGSDPDLASLRDDTEFRALVAAWGKAAPGPHPP